MLARLSACRVVLQIPRARHERLVADILAMMSRGCCDESASVEFQQQHAALNACDECDKKSTSSICCEIRSGRSPSVPGRLVVICGVGWILGQQVRAGFRAEVVKERRLIDGWMDGQRKLRRSRGRREKISQHVRAS